MTEDIGQTAEAADQWLREKSKAKNIGLSEQKSPKLRDIEVDVNTFALINDIRDTVISYPEVEMIFINQFRQNHVVNIYQPICFNKEGYEYYFSAGKVFSGDMHLELRRKKLDSLPRKASQIQPEDQDYNWDEKLTMIYSPIANHDGSTRSSIEYLGPETYKAIELPSGDIERVPTLNTKLALKKAEQLASELKSYSPLPIKPNRF